MVRNRIRVRNRVRGKDWGKFGAMPTVSYSFCLVRCLLCHLIFFKTLIMALRHEFYDDVICSDLLKFTLVTCLKRDKTHLLHEALCQALYRM